MKINDLIFNEIQPVSADPIENEYFSEEILPLIEAQEDDNSDLSFWFLPENSFLFHALVRYFRNRANFLSHVRSVIADDDGIYFPTGVGYDIISADLLGGQADGQARQDFLNWINQHR